MKTEPALLIGAVTAALVLLAAQFNVVLDEASVEAVIGPIVVAVVTRFFVSPVKA